MIDSLELFESLKTANLPETQARAIAQAIGKAWDDNEARQAKALAQKADTAKLDSEVHLVETSLKHDISSLGIEIRAEMRAMSEEVRAEMRVMTEQLRSEFKGEIGVLRSEVKGEIGALRSEFKGEIGALRSEVKGDIAALRSEVKGEIGVFRSEVKGDIAQLEVKIAESKTSMIRWMFVFWVGQLAAMKFLR
jgi:hypothetical protein